MCCRASSSRASRISLGSFSIRPSGLPAFSTSRPTLGCISTARISGRHWAGGASAAARTWFCRSWVRPLFATDSDSWSIPRPTRYGESAMFPRATRPSGSGLSRAGPNCSMRPAWSSRPRSTNTRSCATPGCSAAATSSTTAIRRGSPRSPMMNPPSDQNPMAMKIPFYALFALLIPLAHAQQPVAPDVLVKSITEEVAGILKQDKDIQAGDTKKAADLIETKIVPHFDFIRMTRIAMGRNWRLASPEQQKVLADEFKTLLVRTYSTALSNYRDQQIDYKPLRAKPDDTEVTVRSDVKPSGSSQPVSIDYEMEKTPDGWKVYDVKVGGVSLVTTYRDTFASEVREHGVDGLIKSLAAKNRQGERTRSGKT